MSWYTACHNCGEEGHYARQCTATAGPAGPPPLQATPAAVEWMRGMCDAIRGDLGWGTERCEEPTMFRTVMRIPARTPGQLRQIAARQVAESRAGRTGKRSD